jgi:hypothetical protein
MNRQPSFAWGRGARGVAKPAGASFYHTAPDGRCETAIMALGSIFDAGSDGRFLRHPWHA